MSRDDWKSVIQKLPRGLSYQAAARKLGQPYASSRKWLLRFGYAYKDGRGNAERRRATLMREYAGVDWRKSNIGLALELGKTREWIRQVRDIVASSTFVEARGRRKKSLTSARR